MLIDSDDCSGCGQCIPYCPVGAISMDDDVSEIDFEECTECGNCLQPDNRPGEDSCRIRCILQNLFLTHHHP